MLIRCCLIHYAIRRVKKDEDNIIRERLANCIVENKQRNFWMEIKRIRSKKSCMSRVIDGNTDAQSIAKLFAAKYRDLYTSVPYNNVELKGMIEDVDQQLLQSGFVTGCIINVSDVKSAVQRLKAHKNDGDYCLSTDHILNAPDDCLLHISWLLSAIIIHGCLPDSFTVNTVVPIPKGHNVNMSDSENYRGIALGSIFSKLFDNIVLHRYGNNLVSSQLQFGFKTKSSTSMCSMVLKETMAYYSKNQSSVFCTFLDASKAFDRVQYCKLFKMLIKRNLPAFIIRVLINFYMCNFVRISWCGVVSDYFCAINGVKQGGVLSPVLFCLYIDELLLRLTRAGIGCHIGNYYVGTLAYADDVVLIAPTASAMRKMLTICDSFATEYCVSFNAKKSKCLVALPASKRCLYAQLSECVFYVDGKPIEFVKSYSHLGHIINARMDDADDICHRQGTFIGQVNNVLCYFSALNSHTKCRLFQSYCTSFYGCELWRLSDIGVQDFCTAWRKSVRKIWKLPNKTHCYMLPLLCQCLPVFDEICVRSLNFIDRCLSHDSDLIKFIAWYCIKYGRSRSCMGRNIMFCMQRYNCSVEKVCSGLMNDVIKSFVNTSTDSHHVALADLLHEIIMVRDKFLMLPGWFTCDDIDDIIFSICVS